MTYYNPVGHMGYRAVRGSARRRRASTRAIVPDLPLDELDGWADAADAAGVETVLLAAPTTPDDRLRAICERVARLRLRRRADGRHRRARRSWRARPREMGRRLKAVTDKPVLLGVGISNAEQAVEAAQLRPTA